MTMKTDDLEFGVILDHKGEILELEHEEMYSPDQVDRIKQLVKSWVDEKVVPISIRTDIFCFNMTDEVGCENITFNIIGTVFNEYDESLEDGDSFLDEPVDDTKQLNMGQHIDIFI